jgi:hypothetical protein
MKLVTVYSTFNPTEAEVMRSRLDVSGFHAVITHGLAALSVDGYSLATGGILVQVPDVEAEDARDLLNAAEDPPTEETNE